MERPPGVWEVKSSIRVGADFNFFFGHARGMINISSFIVILLFPVGTNKRLGSEIRSRFLPASEVLDWKLSQPETQSLCCCERNALYENFYTAFLSG